MLSTRSIVSDCREETCITIEVIPYKQNGNVTWILEPDTEGSGSILFVALHCCRRTRSSEMVEGGGRGCISQGVQTSFKQTSLTCNIHNSKKHCSRFDDFATIKILSTRSMVFAEGNVISFEIFITRRVKGGGNAYVHVLYFAFEAFGKQNKQEQSVGVVGMRSTRSMP